MQSYNLPLPECASLSGTSSYSPYDTDLSNDVVKRHVNKTHNFSLLPDGTISAALILRRNELGKNPSTSAKAARTETTAHNVLLRFQIHITFIFLPPPRRFQKFRGVLWIPLFPWLFSNPYIVCKGQPGPNPNERAVPAP